jgi:hypothetical protein
MSNTLSSLFRTLWLLLAACSLSLISLNSYAYCTGVICANTAEGPDPNLPKPSVLKSAPPTSENSYNIGSFFGGGVIFWIDPAADPKDPHGLIADIADQPGGMAYKWDALAPDNAVVVDAPGQIVEVGASGTAAYAGKNVTDGNTYKMISKIGARRSQAAQACAGNARGGFHDWYLPSLIELATMQGKQALINGTSMSHGGKPFVMKQNDGIYSLYWSSTELDGKYAWYYHFFQGQQYSDAPKGMPFNVRCIRAF